MKVFPPWFASKLYRRADGCWNWYYAKNKGGYGTIRYKGPVVLAHRLAYCLANDLELEAIEGDLVRHRCDNRKCCNPEHLELGTYLDNNTDREIRGRAVYLPGSNNGQAKLTKEQVLEIRASSKTQSELAREYGMHVSTIHLIVHRKKWKHI